MLQKQRLIDYFLLLAIAFFFGHLVYIFFDTDVNLQLLSIFLDIILGSLFLLAIFRLDFAFFATLILLPVFFILENVSVINQIYNSASLSGMSFYAVDPRMIGFSIAIFFAIIFVFEKKSIKLFKIPLAKVMPVAIFFFCLTTLWSVGGQEKYVQVSFYILLITLYFTTYLTIENKTSFNRLIGFFIILSLPAILMAYFQIFSGLFFEYADMDIQRVSGPFNSPNLLGSFLLVTSAMAIVLWISNKKERGGSQSRGYLMMYLALALPIFFLTFSRSAWLGMVVFLGIFSLQSKKFMISASLVFTLLLSVMFMFESTRERVSGFSDRTMFDSVYARTNIWRMSYEKFLEKPWLGYGAGSFSEVINDTKESAGGTDNPHNDIVFFAVEGGIIGVISFLSIVISFYFYLFKFHFRVKKLKPKKYKNSSQLQILSLGIIALFIAMTVIGTVESYYEGNFLHLFVWSLLGGWFALVEQKLIIVNEC